MLKIKCSLEIAYKVTCRSTKYFLFSGSSDFLHNPTYVFMLATYKGLTISN